MRILHFADLHPGVETYGDVDPATGLSTRLLDARRSMTLKVAIEAQDIDPALTVLAAIARYQTKIKEAVV